MQSIALIAPVFVKSNLVVVYDTRSQTSVLHAVAIDYHGGTLVTGYHTVQCYRCY